MHNLYRATPPLTPSEERDLSARAKAGDRAAESRMLSSVAALVQSLAGSACRAGDDLDNLAQVGMIAAWRALRTFDPSLGRWSSWSARHARFDMLHARQDEALGVPLTEVAAPPHGPEEDEEAADRQQAESALRAALRVVLGEEDAEVVACRILEGLSETQCSRLLHRSWRTVRASEQRGVARLREVVRARA